MLLARLSLPGLLSSILLLLVTGCASAPRSWQPRTVASCTAALGAPLDQERTYLAALLALSSRKYAVLHSEAPHSIEAESRSDYHPEIYTTRWVMRVRPDGSLEVDAPDNQRATHDRTESWYQRLSMSIQQLQCRDLNWLRWEAQNRGLLAIGAGVADAPELGAGGEAHGEPLPFPAEERAARQGRLDSLRSQRSDLHLWRSVAWGGLGVGLVAAGAGVGSSALNARALCEGEPGACSDVPRALAYTALGLAVAGGVVLAVSVPITLRKGHRYRALSREMKPLKDPRLSLSPLGVTLHGSF
jgi:hypothetical protein